MMVRVRTAPISTVDIVLPVRNAVEILPGTLRSLCEQTYPNFRVVVVDGASTDGTLAILEEFGSNLELDVVSEPDAHVSDALAKGLSRATADVVGIIAADERYESCAIETAVDCFRARPEAVVCAGRAQFIEAMADGEELVVDGYLPEEFDVIRHLACEVVWPVAATFFHRRVLGGELRYETTTPTCPDYELWARLGLAWPGAAFVRVETPMSRAFRSAVSMSFRPEAFGPMVTDKLAHLDVVLESLPPGLRDALHESSKAGIHMWAAEQLSALGASPALILDHCRAAQDLVGVHDRLTAFLNRSRVVRVTPGTGLMGDPIPVTPPATLQPISTLLEVRTQENWPGAHVHGSGPWTVRTADEPWGFSAEVILLGAADDEDPSMTSERWFVIEVEVLDGAVGIGTYGEGQLTGEVVVRPEEGRRLLHLWADAGVTSSVMVRSAGRAGSRVVIHRAEFAGS